MGNAQRKAAHPKNAYTPTSIPKKVHWDAPGLPAPPGKPILIPGSEDSQSDVVGIRWERSPHNGGTAIIGYLVEHRKMGSPNWIRSAPVLCTYPEMTLSGLEPGWRYQFRIKARNALGMSEPSELSDPLSVSLQRAIADSPKFDLELKDTVVMESGPVEFIVLFSGTPPPKISWFKDGFEIFSSRRTVIETDNGKSVFSILRTILDDEGEIKCSATNKAGHVSTRAILRLEAPPRIRLPQQYEEGLLFEQGESIRTKAIVTGRPPPSITWYHDGEIIPSDGRHVFESITECESILKIPEAKRQDRGEYSIRAINKLGEDIASFLVTVTDRPSAPGKVQISAMLGTSVTISWKEPEDDGGCKIGNYIIEYYRIGWDVWLKAATCRQTTVTLNDLIEDSQYCFRVKAESPYGVSEPCEKSDVIFIPDPKRGITQPNMKEKSQSHRDIPRGRSERREVTFTEPKPRTRSLTREEASTRRVHDEYTVSTQRLVIGGRPSRADSRVTFALDTTTSDKSESTKKQWSKEQLPHPTDALNSTKANDISKNLCQPTTITITPSVDDPGVRPPRGRSVSKERSLSPLLSRDKVDNVYDHERTHLSPVRTVRKTLKEIRDEQPVSLRSFEGDDENNVLHGSSEFMLVLYPEDRTEHIQSAEAPSSTDSKINHRLSVDLTGEETDDDLVPPPMSLSLPELFSPNHQITEILREAVSSTELLHERAMERFYRAVAAENATDQPQRPASLDAETSNRLSTKERYALFDSTNRVNRRRLSSSGNQVISWQMKRDRRRSSEGQGDLRRISLQIPQIMNKNTISDPNLLIDNKAATPSPDGKVTERLRRWNEPGIDLTKVAPVTTTTTSYKMVDDEKEDEIYDEVEFEEESLGSFGSEAGSTDSEDLKRLRARILAIPVMDEEDTYHPRGTPIQHVELQPPPVPPHRIPVLDISPPIPDRTFCSSPPQSPTSLSPTPDKVPKSILKKRTDNEPIPLNQFGRPIPPEKPIRKSLPVAFNDESDAILRNRSSTNLDQVESSQIGTSDVDYENEAVISAAEAARTKRRQMKQNSKSLDAENEVEQEEERQAVVSHYMELVQDYSKTNPNKYRSISRDRDTLSPEQIVRKESSPVPMSATRPKSPSIERPIPQRPNITPSDLLHRSRREEDNQQRRNSTSGKVRSGPPSRNESPVARSRNVSKERRPRNVSRDRRSSISSKNALEESGPVIRSRNVSKDCVPGSRSSSATRTECFSPVSKPTKKSSRPSSRSSSRDRSRGSTPTEARLERLQRALNDKKHRPRKMSTRDEVNEILMTIEAERNVRSTLSYVTDVGLLLAAMYVYFFKREILAIPIIGLLLYRYVQQEISDWFLRRH